MLVLSRKENERLLFPTLGISVEVVRIQGNRIKLGVHAPPDIPVLRHELADLKGLEFSSDAACANNKLFVAAKLVRRKVGFSTESLNLLHEHLQGDHAGQSLVMDVFRELRDLERETTDLIDESEARQTPHALLIHTDSTERDLLASCLRIGGIEVAVAASAGEALDYLSLHACPDFALLDTTDGGAGVVAALRSNSVSNGVRLFGLGDDPIGVDRLYPRPINAEQLVDELVREFEGQVAV